MPPKFGTLLVYACDLKFNQAPDYGLCRKIFRAVCEKEDVVWDVVYGWTIKHERGAFAHVHLCMITSGVGQAVKMEFFVVFPS